jgi:hypothetical protein
VPESGKKKTGKISGFIVYCNERRTLFKQQGSELKMSEQTKVTAQEWNAFTDERK